MFVRDSISRLSERWMYKGGGGDRPFEHHLCWPRAIGANRNNHNKRDTIYYVLTMANCAIMRCSSCTHPWIYGLAVAGYKCGGRVGLADGKAAGSWYSVLSDWSSIFWSTLCAFEADLMSMNETVAHTPVPPSATSSFDLASILTLCTRPYLWQTHTSKLVAIEEKQWWRE